MQNRKWKSRIQQWVYKHRELRKRTAKVGQSFEEVKELIGGKEDENTKK